jgi:ubiquitin-conjugating enzyme E2 Q
MLSQSCFSDFNEIVACDYRPGLVRIGLDELVLSVSKPTFKLAETIPPQALMAWDRKLLSSVKNLTLVISGIRGVYPVLLADGTLNPRLRGLTFRLGLTTGYKPDSALALQLARSFASDGIVRERKGPESTHSDESDNENSEEGSSDIHEEKHEEEKHEDEKEHKDSFSFSLTSSLDALMNDQFLILLQIRLRYGCGWAAAEALLSEVNQSQSKMEDVFGNRVMVRNLSIH